MKTAFSFVALAMLLAAPPPVAAASRPAAAAPRSVIITMDKMKFGPAPSGLRVGDRVTWTNRDMFRHTATAGDGSFNVDLPPGASATVVVRKAGAISVTCRYHPAMKTMLVIAK